jgi:hypothetical protein
MGHEIIQLLISYVALASSCNKETIKEINLHGILQKPLIFNAVNTLNNYGTERFESYKQSVLAVNTPPVPLLARYVFVA